jgi:hypothetical protein
MQVNTKTYFFYLRGQLLYNLCFLYALLDDKILNQIVKSLKSNFYFVYFFPVN